MQRVGVVGLGRMGMVHLRNYSEMPGVTIAGVTDTAEAARKNAAERFGVPTFADLDALLARKPEAVSVCVPTVLHHAVGLKVIESGANLLIEKPLAASAAEGEELVAAAKRRGVTLMVGHIERFNPAVRRLKELLGDDVISVQIERVGPYPARIQDVGVIWDLGPHDLDLVRHLTGSEFAEVHSVFATSRGSHEDNVFVAGRMENGVLASISANWSTPFRSRKIRVAAKSKFFIADLMTQKVTEYGPFDDAEKRYTVREWPVVAREQAKEELSAFLAALREHKPAPITGEDGLAALRAIERVMAGGRK